MSLQPGDLLGPYKIQALLGVGGMGEVYRARDTRLGREVAIKVISPTRVGDLSRRRRFATEARATSALNHPSIVTVYDVGETEGVSWIAMEWVDERTLREALAGGPLPLRDALSIARQIAEGLAAAHAKGVVHRDLKPENIMVTLDGRAKILDFGLARHTLAEALDSGTGATSEARASSATVEGSILGTVGYMSPEQASGRAADFRSDQFAFGVILYEMLAGRRAFDRPGAVETLSAIIHDDPVSLSSVRGGIPEPVQQVIERCLSKLPERRFGSTRDLATALETIASGQPFVTVPPDFSILPTAVRGRRFHAPTWRRPRWRVAALIGAALALTLATAVWMRFGTSPHVIDSLAVLPFENATKDPEAEYLGDGLTESLIDQMSRLPSLKVMARTTVLRYRNTADPQAAGRQLGVGAVLTGTISKRGPQLVISAELMETSSGARLWGRTYDRPSADLLHVQESIASEIAEGLRLRLSGEEKRTLAAQGTSDPKAYEMFLRARALMHHDTEEDDLAARALFRQALERDPRFVDAQLGVASIYARAAGNGYAPPIEAWSRADAEVRKALQLDPGNFAARVTLAVRHFLVNWDWPAAEREFRELASDPRLFTRNQYHPATLFFWATGRPAESVALLEKALRVDPKNVESRVMMADLLADAGRLDESIRLYEAIAAAEPFDPRPLFGLAKVLRQRGQATRAIEMLRKAYELAEEEVGVRALATALFESDYDDAQIAVARDRLRGTGEGAVCITTRSGPSASADRKPRRGVRIARAGVRGEVARAGLLESRSGLGPPSRRCPFRRNCAAGRDSLIHSPTVGGKMNSSFRHRRLM